MRRSARLLLRLLLVFGTAPLLVLLMGVRVGFGPLPAKHWSQALAWGPGPDQVWETPVTEAEATVAGLTWEGPAPERAWVRSSPDGRRWSPWTEIPIADDHGPDPGTDEARGSRPGTDPVWVGESGFVQFRVQAADPERVRADFVEGAGRHLNPAQAVLARMRSLHFELPAASGLPSQPQIVPRSAWGGDQCHGPDPPAEVWRVEALVVHHTSATTDYRPSDVLSYIYSICVFHVQSRGWNDIAYNFLIDDGGVIYEGRAGGVERGIRGAHTRGFSRYSTGVAFLGNCDRRVFSANAQQALADLGAWKLNLSHVDPLAYVEREAYLDTGKFDEGEMVRVPTVMGHRDAVATACPGDACYGILSGLRTAIDRTGGAKVYWQPSADPVRGSQGRGYEPAELRIRFTATMSWRLQIADEAGDVVLDRAGSGTSATVGWDGRFGGANLPKGVYTVRITAGPASGPTEEIDDRIRLGHYDPPFSDDEDSVHESDIDAIAALGITRGCNPPLNDLYCPERTTSRGEMAAFINRALRLPPASADYFTDDETSTFEDDINRLAEAGITTGCGPGRYCPNEVMTREQMAVFLVRGFGLDDPGADAFVDDETSPFEAEINRLAQAGVTKGCNPPANDRYCPTLAVTRAQMASFLIRAIRLGS